MDAVGDWALVVGFGARVYLCGFACVLAGDWARTSAVAWPWTAKAVSSWDVSPSLRLRWAYNSQLRTGTDQGIPTV